MASCLVEIPLLTKKPVLVTAQVNKNKYIMKSAISNDVSLMAQCYNYYWKNS